MKLEDALKTTKFRDAKHKATLNILYTAYWYKDHFSTLLKEQDMTMEQFNVLRILKGKHPEKMCVKDIGSRMIEKSSNVPRIIDRLVAKRLAKRVTSKLDKRETLISLTEKGVSQLEVASKALYMETEQILGVTEDEAVVLNGLLEKMRTID